MKYILVQDILGHDAFNSEMLDEMGDGYPEVHALIDAFNKHVSDGGLVRDTADEATVLTRTYNLTALKQRAEAAESDWQQMCAFVEGLRREGADCWCENGTEGHTPTCLEAQRLTNPLPF
jgi:hypothetical protein